jgi:lipopolysaccharide biosynthesis glycosyltransferase
MESALKNSNKNKTTLVYHVLCAGDLKMDNLKKIKSLLLKYPFNLEIIFYNMSNIFINLKNQVHSQLAYFRLLTPIFIPIKKIIYLDSDVLIFKDLLEMYQTSFNNNYVLGILDVISDAVDYLGLKSDKYINSGILLNIQFLENSA